MVGVMIDCSICNAMDQESTLAWPRLEETISPTVYINPVFEKSSSSIKFQYVLDFITPPISNFHFSSIKISAEVNCDAKETRIEKAEFYSEERARGFLLKTEKSLLFSWEKNLEGSLGESILKNVCKFN